MKPPRNLKKYLDGKLPLPAGFVPLAELGKHVVCLGADGDWWNYYTDRKDSFRPTYQLDSQRFVMATAVATLGGTSAKAAKAIGVSPRTVESWRCGRKRLTVERAYQIARAMTDA